MINEQIRDREVRLISENGEQLGIMSARDAYKRAQEAGLDLVKIAPQATPPVCKIMDYGKFKFEQAKREKEARKNQKVIEIKEIRLSLNIDTNDFNTKVNRAVKFLEGGASGAGYKHYETLYRGCGRIRKCGKAAENGRPQHGDVHFAQARNNHQGRK